MRKNTYSGPCCAREGTKMCRSSQTFFIPFTHSWVSRILSCIWYSNTMASYIDTSRTRWSSWTSPRLAQCTNTLSKLSKSLNRRRETLNLWIRRPKDKAKEGWPNTTHRSRRKRTTSRSRRRTQESCVSSIRAPLTTKVSVVPSSRWWPSWRLPNQMHVLTLSQNPKRGMAKGIRSLMRSPVPLLPLPRSKRMSPKIQRRGSVFSTHKCGWRARCYNSLSIVEAKRTSF